MPDAAPPPAEQIIEFLADHHEAEVTDLEALSGGFWSSAFGYAVDGRRLVLRLGSVPEGFVMDRYATRYSSPDLPIPKVFTIGDAFGQSFAITARHDGRFLETIGDDEVDRAGPMLAGLLEALRTAPTADDVRVDFADPATATTADISWRQWLRRGLVDDPRSRVAGWRKTIAADERIDRVFRRAEARIDELLDACPERRDVVHNDLLHQNVLIDDDATSVTAVFSWKCAAHGDFLYDVALCTFWGTDWHPPIGATNVFQRTIDRLTDHGDTEALVDAAERHHCYELQIGATHFGWNAWTGNTEALREVVDATERVLDRGPVTTSIRP